MCIISCGKCKSDFEVFFTQSGFYPCDVYRCSNCANSISISVYEKDNLKREYIIPRGIYFEDLIAKCECGGSYKKIYKTRCPSCRGIIPITDVYLQLKDGYLEDRFCYKRKKTFMGNLRFKLRSHRLINGMRIKSKHTWDLKWNEEIKSSLTKRSS